MPVGGEIIREAVAADAAAIRHVVASAFGQTLEADLVDALRMDGDSVLSLVAVQEALIVGHILLSRMNAPFPALGLAPVSVLPERSGHGIASRLIERGLALAQRAGWHAVFVLGDPGFYTRFGFDAELAKGFASPYAGPYFMVKPLQQPLSATTGSVNYAPAFDRLA